VPVKRRHRPIANKESVFAKVAPCVMSGNVSVQRQSWGLADLDGDDSENAENLLGLASQLLLYGSREVLAIGKKREEFATYAQNGYILAVCQTYC
jgi:hypothetical protein